MELLKINSDYFTECSNQNKKFVRLQFGRLQREWRKFFFHDVANDIVTVVL